ncbi:MAG: T9SS type A sorting domain-containing protein [Bacteroidetes bacterium]|nr:T9SS C-terminal target domain-containing protein [Bacteroidota bacterium]NOG58212.1 T9SS type A sorting domain-containing protein [Bacteroidota bacterium]
MKKNYFLGALLFVTSMGYSQKTIIVNGGKYGNQNENVNVMVYDANTNTHRVIDTIHSQSVQEIIFEGTTAYVAAQDSIVSYDLKTEKRIAATSFNGLSTKSLAILGTDLLVGNYYGKTTDNLYLYDKQTLVLRDSITALSKTVSSILTFGNKAYIPQNVQTANYTDTLAYIVVIDIPNRTIIDTISISGYSGDFGELILNPNHLGFISINSQSNTISKFSFNNLNAGINTSFTNDLSVTNRSLYTVYNDTLFLRMDNGIGALNINSLALIDAKIVDTVITGFTYDTLNSKFYVTQTDFFSYQAAKEYGRNGIKVKEFTVGFSPEVIRMYYGQSVGIEQLTSKEFSITVYPNPTADYINLDFSTLNTNQVEAVLITQNGQEVFRKRLSINSNRIDLSNCNSGFYFLIIKTDKSVYTTKIVKYD